MSFRRLRRAAGLAAVISILTLHAAEARHYQLVPQESSIRIHVGRSGFLKGLGHEHDVAAPVFSGAVDTGAANLVDSRVTATFESKSLQVLPGGDSSSDVAKVQRTMLGPKVLDTQRYPRITVTSRRITATAVGPGVFDVQLSGDLALHGVVRPIRVPLRVEIGADRLVARGATTIRQTDFGISPVSNVAGGIKVKNELSIQFTIVGRATQD
jgi:polyisoprenoid-binding protein YceI